MSDTPQPPPPGSDLPPTAAMPATPPAGADPYGAIPPGGLGGTATASSGDGITAGLGALAIVGLLVAIVALWLTRCDVSVLERLVESLQEAAS